MRKLEKKHPRLHFCYQAGPTGYRLLPASSVSAAMHADPKRRGERVKTNPRDAGSLTRLLRWRTEEIWVPGAVYEAAPAPGEIKHRVRSSYTCVSRTGTRPKIDGAVLLSLP
ncbi:hypothetical protein NKH70_26135 [Mesorhizobium sp. M0991]|uniref:hypothetical protein n=1 Tax=Mesorhizobium sp. M0991 TaxID=2957043 RepID=UPI003339AF74